MKSSPTHARSSYVAHPPLGVVLSILPWNFPVWQIFRCAASALMAGNVIIMKHAPNVQGCASAGGRTARGSRCCRRARSPNLHAPVAAVAGIIADPRVAAVTLTGSPGCWRQGCRAGRRRLQEVRARTGRFGCLHRAGRCRPGCSRCRRRARHDSPTAVRCASLRSASSSKPPSPRNSPNALPRAAAALRRGDPLQTATQLGPMARADLREQLEAQVQASVKAGREAAHRRHIAARARAGSTSPPCSTKVTAAMPVVVAGSVRPRRGHAHRARCRQCHRHGQ